LKAVIIRPAFAEDMLWRMIRPRFQHSTGEIIRETGYAACAAYDGGYGMAEDADAGNIIA